MPFHTQMILKNSSTFSLISRSTTILHATQNTDKSFTFRRNKKSRVRKNLDLVSMAVQRPLGWILVS